jgi:menaquinone-dependent protoporphyrinogen oxidase
MDGSILVAYATRYGSTREVAEAIGARLREHGAGVKVQPARDVLSLDGAAAVVLGTPLYFGSMQKDAVAFLERHASGLALVPVAVFVLGPASAADGVEGSRSQFEEALAKLPWLTPVATEVFVGKYDPAKFRLADKLIAALPASPLHGVPAHDERDWAAIEAWADALPAVLQQNG